MNSASATMTRMTRMVHNMMRLRSLLVPSEGIRGLRVASHPNPVADAARPYLESPTDTNSCLGQTLGGERQPQKRLGADTPELPRSAAADQITSLFSGVRIADDRMRRCRTKLAASQHAIGNQ